MSGIDDVYRKIVEVEVRVKSCGNRSFCHGRWRSCGDWRWRFKVDTCRNVLVSCYPSIDRFAKKVHRKCHLPSFHDIRVYFVSRFARIFYGNDVSRSQFLFFTQFDIYIHILFGEITWRRFSKLRTFSLLESENQCLKKCSIIGMLSSRTPISTTHLSSWNKCRKDELRVFLTNVYIQILDACRSVERSIARDILLTTRKGKLWIGYSKW